MVELLPSHNLCLALAAVLVHMQHLPVCSLDDVGPVLHQDPELLLVISMPVVNLEVTIPNLQELGVVHARIYLVEVVRVGNELSME